MLVTLLPFFLVANVVVDDSRRQSEWTTYGAECTYDVFVNMSLANVVHEGDNYCSMIVSELKCRPKGDDSLSCYFGSFNIRRPDPKKSRCTNTLDLSTQQKFLDEKPFEIRFNPHGIENLVVHRTIPRWRLALIKNIVSQLNIGFKVQENRDRFSMQDNSAIGQCEADVQIIRGDPESAEDDDDDDSSAVGANFMIGFASSNNNFTQPIEKTFRVKKVRDAKRCTRTTNIGNQQTLSRNNPFVLTNMTESISHIEISKDRFMTYTISEGMRKGNMTQIMRSRENLRLKLKRIDFARSPLPEIQDPSATGILAFSDIEYVREYPSQ
ncbi:uncharacterized protein LOC105285599 [Ooceraea biroi]|uniref:Vitellogenin domain-containing protein n=1 Tax=Ooceraea biroi TaxID=2015173 RepID=A0A026VXK1_OOCBI|nr:uncharacterized protein LOC105285599 [Ooceraea biroi]EZA48400.1 hypothetical protein X777_13707 [Ooceraea biroi]